LKRVRRFWHWKTIAVFCALLLIGIAGSVAYVIETFGPSPRLLAPYVLRRVTQHNSAIVHAGQWVASTLIALDRGRQYPYNLAGLQVGAQNNAPLQQASDAFGTRQVHISTAEELLRAVSQARPGDEIVLAPGLYRFQGRSVDIRQDGSPDRRIVLRAERPDTAVLELSTLEGIHVSAPYWTFENLTLRGTCSQHANCEHAFHVVGDAHHFVARNNTIVDFNAHFKINRIGDKFPDAGLIEGNTLTNRSVRNTYSSVTPIDLVAASGWIIRRNLITDFIKGQSDQTSYGAFAKGAGADNRFEQNIVICENLLRGAPGRRVGLSLGGGGTKDSFCRDSRCIVEQERGVLESNLIASCSDEGIYVNRGAGSRIIHNTVIDTAGVTIRYSESSADLEGNLVDASIRSRDDGIARKLDNVETPMVKIYTGLHPVRDLFQTAPYGSFLWASEPPRRGATDKLPLDMCGRTRPAAPAYGAFEQFRDCLAQGKAG
jgi:parallel beta-helix repeat protein